MTELSPPVLASRARGGGFVFRWGLGRLGDVLLMLLVVFAIPLAILLLGLPIALLIRAVIEVANIL